MFKMLRAVIKLVSVSADAGHIIGLGDEIKSRD